MVKIDGFYRFLLQGRVFAHENTNYYLQTRLVRFNDVEQTILTPGNTKGGSITVPLTSCLTGLDWSVLQIKTKIVSCPTANSKPVEQEVNSAVILPPLVFSSLSIFTKFLL